MTGSPAVRFWLNEQVVQAGVLKIEDKVYQLPPALPHNERLEQALLGALLNMAVNGDGIASMRRIGYLRYDDFYFYRHGIIFRAMGRLLEREQQPDVTAIATLLATIKNRDGSFALASIGGEAYLLELANGAALNVETYAGLLMDLSIRRATIAVASIMTKLAEDGRLELDNLAHQINLMVVDIGTRISTIRGRHTYLLEEAVTEHMRQVEVDMENENFETGITTGFKPLNEKLLGWRRKKMYVIAGSTGMGKSAFLLSSALAAYRAGKRVLFISLELTLEEILDRLICNLASVDSYHFQTREVSEAELQRLRNVIPTVQTLKESGNFVIVCLNHPTMTELNNRIDDLMLDNQFDAMFIDYIGWNTVADAGKHRGDNTVAHTGNLWNVVNTYKKSYDIPVIVGCQISRDHEKRKDKHPRLSDLSDSSMIEKNADAVIFLFRPEKYEEIPEHPGRAEAIIAKNRSGRGGDKASGIAYIMSELQYNRFSEWDPGMDAFVTRGRDWFDI